MIDWFDPTTEFEFFGLNQPREHSLCPHCGKQGNKVDEGDVLWNERILCRDFDYACATCQGEWIIRVYRYSGFERYPGPHSALIYIPASAAQEKS